MIKQKLHLGFFMVLSIAPSTHAYTKIFDVRLGTNNIVSLKNSNFSIALSEIG
jgi:hypothetical protein